MTCERARPSLIDAARHLSNDEDALRHAEQCPECARELQRQKDLTLLLSGMAESMSSLEAQPAAEGRVRAAFGRRPVVQTPVWIAAGAAVAAILILGFWSRQPVKPPLQPRAPGAIGPVRPPIAMEKPAEPRPVHRAPVRRSRAGQEVATDFMPLRRGPILDPEEIPHVFRIRLPRSEMRRFGFPVSFDLEESAIQADVIVGRDGMARAIRFVH